MLQSVLARDRLQFPIMASSSHKGKEPKEHEEQPLRVSVDDAIFYDQARMSLYMMMHNLKVFPARPLDAKLFEDSSIILLFKFPN